jgi:hypothetical protein
MKNNHEYFKNQTSLLKYGLSYLGDGEVRLGKALRYFLLSVKILAVFNINMSLESYVG